MRSSRSGSRSSRSRNLKLPKIKLIDATFFQLILPGEQLLAHILYAVLEPLSLILYLLIL